MNSEKIRTFICIVPPKEIVKEITRVQELIKNKQFIGKITEPENLHLTLKFLGEISKETLNKIKSILSNVYFNKFEATLSKTGIFSYKKNPRIAWIKISGQGIFDLQAKIDEALSPLFKPEERFMSHLTIARIKYVKNKQDFIKTINSLPLKKLSFQINEFKLIKSELAPLGPKYTTLKTYKSVQ